MWPVIPGGAFPNRGTEREPTNNEQGALTNTHSFSGQLGMSSILCLRNERA